MLVSKNYDEWKKIAVAMGLEELNNVSPRQVVGYYRNHHVKIFGDPRSGVVDETNHRPPKTLYVVEFENPKAIQIYLKKRFSLTVIFHGHDLLMSYLNDIRVDDPEFDRRFMVKGNKESDVKAVLDSSIRNKIINAKFNEAEIGYMAFWSDKNSQNSIPKWISRIPRGP